MKKITAVILTALLILTLCSCSVNIGKKEEATTQTQVYTVPQTTQVQQTQSAEETVQATEAQTSYQPELQPTQQAVPATEEQTTIAVKTYYSDNPNNKYIVAVADRYGVDKACLVAFIRTNSSVPGANVLQFKGNRDASGNLITTKDELVYVYDVLDDGTFRKTNREGTEIDGYSGIPFANIAAKATFKLTEEQIMPNIEKYKTDSRYRYD